MSRTLSTMFSTMLAALSVTSAVVLVGCGECEFSIIPKSDSCPGGCATLNRADIAEGVICADYDCDAENPCASGFVCVSVGKPVCLPSCDDDTDCENGLVCTDQIDGVSGGDTLACFFDG